MGGDEFVHEAEVAFGDLFHAGDPFVDDGEEFFAGGPERGAAAGFEEGSVSVEAFAGVADEVADGVFTLSWWSDLVEETACVQFGGGVGGAAEDHALGGLRAEFAGEQTVRAHAGEEVEEDFGEAHFRLLFGDHEVGGEGGFEAAAEGVALEEGDADDFAIEPADEVVEDADAGLGVVRQAVPIVVEGALAEEREVAAEVEDFGHGGGGDVEVHRDFAVADQGMELMGVGEERLGETRTR